jgi:hypothetical protein
MAYGSNKSSSYEEPSVSLSYLSATLFIIDTSYLKHHTLPVLDNLLLDNIRYFIYTFNIRKRSHVFLWCFGRVE